MVEVQDTTCKEKPRNKESGQRRRIPFQNTDGEIVAAVTYEFEDDCNTFLGITAEDPVGTVILSNNNAKAIVEKAKKWADLLSVYLHIEEI